MPFTVKIDTQDVGGPSAGMMFALGIFDTLTPGSLTGGKQIAGTGTIDRRRQRSAPIGGIAQKLVGAQQRGAMVPGAGLELRRGRRARAGRAARGEDPTLHAGPARRREDRRRQAAASPADLQADVRGQSCRVAGQRVRPARAPGRGRAATDAVVVVLRAAAARTARRRRAAPRRRAARRCRSGCAARYSTAPARGRRAGRARPPAGTTSAPPRWRRRRPPAGQASVPSSDSIEDVGAARPARRRSGGPGRGRRRR